MLPVDEIRSSNRYMVHTMLINTMFIVWWTRKLLIFRDLRYSQLFTIVGSNYLTVLNDTSHGQKSPFCFVWNVQVNYSRWLAKNLFRAL